MPAQNRQFEEDQGKALPNVLPGTVLPAYLHQDTVSHSWHQCMTRLLVYDANNLRRLRAPYAVHCSGPNSIPEGRNLAAQTMLDGDSRAEWLWFIDTDMGFPADVVDQLVRAALAEGPCVVGALCFAFKNVAPDGYGGYRTTPVPTIFGLNQDQDGHIGFGNRWEYPPDTLLRVAGTGAACLLIHRQVLVDIREKFGDQWFNLAQYGDGRVVSEDLSFCWRVAQVNRPVFVHTGVKTTHHKSIWVGEELYRNPTKKGE